ncbi:MAG: quinoprotein relay system zinc metallohydrolase 1 [Hyphomicrobiaceae bacterium]|nr:quinoprotein relay system zinc metallohydrolase 1 [Hyphomicrobiaceae bacterium]
MTSGDDKVDVSRRQAIAAFAGIATLPALLAVFDANAAPLVYELRPEPIAPGIWVIRGAQEAIERSNGGAIANITIFDTRDGAVIVDTGPSKRYGLALEALVRQLTGKPVVRAYLTHFHPDHVFGNQAFAANVLSAPRGVIDGLAELGESFASAMYHAAGDWMRGTEVMRPGTECSDGVETIGERRFRLMGLGGHTPSDLALIEETSGILVTGDLTFLDRAPTTPHADLARWRSSLDTLSAIAHARLVPGHGPVEEGARGIAQTRDWLSLVEETIRTAFDRGLSSNEAMAEPLPAWTEKVALARYEFERSVMHFYPKLEAGEWPRVDKAG